MNNKDRPLGLPAGSVRAIIALIIVVTCCVMAGVGLEIDQGLWTVLAAAVAFYFGQKVQG